MNITVFLGSTFGSKKQYASDAERIGTWIGEHHHTLIYGGASVGTMGILSSAAKEAGAYVIGIMPQFLVDRGVANNDGLDEQIVVENMDERKKLLIGKADVLVTLLAVRGRWKSLRKQYLRRNLALSKVMCSSITLMVFMIRCAGSTSTWPGKVSSLWRAWK